VKIVMEEVPEEFLTWLQELYDRLTVISTNVDKARRMVLHLTDKMRPVVEEASGEQGTKKGA